MLKNDYIKLKSAFFDYANAFKENDGNFCKLLAEKLEHIKRVSQNCLYIAKNEKWSEEDCLIAELCGLYHDIGRFSQYKKFKTFSDSKSVNHGQEGYEVIINYSFFDFLESSDAQIIMDAVHYHNALNVPNDLSDASVRFTNVTRDADKIDIFYMLTECIRTKTIENHQDLLWNLPIGNANPVIIEKLMNNSQALYSDIKSATDVCLLQLCWLYGMNYKSSIIKLKENKTVELFSEIMPKTDEIKACTEHISHYIDSIIK